MPAFLDHGGTVLHVAWRPGRGTPVVLANSLGTDFRIWDAVVACLPEDVPVLRMDKRGHGLSGTGAASIPDLADDVIHAMEHFGTGPAVLCGVSVGGLIVQSAAAARPDLARALVLSNTGLKIGDDALWNARIETVRTEGLGAMADGILERWFSPAFRSGRPADLAGYRAMLTRTPPEGYAAVCAAIRDCDLTGDAAALTMPAVCIAGETDLATPPEVVRAMADALPDARYLELPGVGHLPCIEAPEAVAGAILGLMPER